jgi:hypothetical protein
VAAVALLLAVPALGLARLGSGLLPSAAGDQSEQVATSNGVLVFDAPATTVARVKYAEKAAATGSATQAGPDDTTVPTDWRFTARRGIRGGEGGNSGNLLILFFLFQFEREFLQFVNQQNQVNQEILLLLEQILQRLDNLSSPSH